jgi:acyl carrier protein
MIANILCSREIIKAFITSHLVQGGAPHDIPEKTDFIAEGYLDSFAVLTLLMALEQEFSFVFKPADLTDEKARTLEGLTDIVLANAGNKNESL